MNSLIITCLLAAAPVPKNWKPPLVITEQISPTGNWCWMVDRIWPNGDTEGWCFSHSYTEAMIREHIEAHDKAKADPLNRK